MPLVPTPRMAICLAVDLKRSTATGLSLSTKKLDRFNIALVQQFAPHLQAVGLEHALVKFTGDGWLVVSDNPDDAAPLCCLAILMACRFRDEMANEVGLTSDGIPALRLAVCWGRDLMVELPGGGRDFVGDSVRHAVRATQICRDDEILIDDTVLRWVHHDFCAERLPLDERRLEFPEAKMEQDLALHILTELRPESAGERDAPAHFVNTLNLIGRETEAEGLAEATVTQRNVPFGNEAALERFHRLLDTNLGYEAANRLLREMREAGLQPDTRAYNALIGKAPDYQTRCVWYARMRNEKIAPDIRTFHLVIEAAPDERTVDKWINRLRRLQITPDTRLLSLLIDRAATFAAAVRHVQQLEALGVTLDPAIYTLLVEKSPDALTGKPWIDRMVRENIPISAALVRSLFARPVGEWSADALLDWFLALPQHPAEAMWNAVAHLRKEGKIADALRLCLDYPQTQAAQRVFREHPDQTLRYFHGIFHANPLHANAAYALGHALRTLNRSDEAVSYFETAYNVAFSGPRKEEIRRLLQR